MKKLTTSEIVLDYIIKLPKNKDSGNQYYIYDIIVKKTGLGEKDIVQSLYFLQDENLIKIINNYSHNNFSSPFLIELTSSGKNYFKNKEEISKEKRDKWIQFWIPVGISVIALLKSFSNEIISLWKLITQLLQ